MIQFSTYFDCSNLWRDQGNGYIFASDWVFVDDSNNLSCLKCGKIFSIFNILMKFMHLALCIEMKKSCMQIFCYFRQVVIFQFWEFQIYFTKVFEDSNFVWVSFLNTYSSQKYEVNLLFTYQFTLAHWTSKMLSHRNQSIDLLYKSIDSFLYDSNFGICMS